MKHLKFLSAFLFIAAITFSGCNKNNDDDEPSGSKGTMSLAVDGSDWSASLAVQGVNSNGVINVTGSDSNANQAAVTLSGVTAPGTYQVGAANPSNMCRWTAGTDPINTYQANFILGSGTVTITEISATKVVGTFQFTGYNTAQASKVITNGSFDVNF